MYGQRYETSNQKNAVMLPTSSVSKSKRSGPTDWHCRDESSSYAPILLPMLTLTGERTRLREFRAEDLEDSLAVVADDEVTRWLSFDSLTRKQQADRLTGAIERAAQQPRNEYYLALTTLDSDRLIGFARLGLSGVRAAKLGYAVAAPRWGKGYATDAARALVSFGFAGLGLHRVTAAVGPDNAASIRVLKRLGFSYEGRLRGHVHTNGAWRDSELYSVLAHEWPS
jgi:[ribosomal protein S5]-alanine N-acetyltransferase